MNMQYHTRQGVLYLYKLKNAQAYEEIFYSSHG